MTLKIVFSKFFTVFLLFVFVSQISAQSFPVQGCQRGPECDGICAGLNAYALGGCVMHTCTCVPYPPAVPAAPMV